MTQVEKKAFRHLLAHAVIWMRACSGPASGRSVESIKAALQQVNAMADLLHNLARYSVDDFVGFEPDLFWMQFRDYRQRFPEFYDCEAAYNRYMTDMVK